MNMLKESQIKEEIIIKFFMENPTFFISEISREISIPKSTIQRYLKKNENLLIESENRTIKYIQFKDKKLLLQNAFPEGGEVL